MMILSPDTMQRPSVHAGRESRTSAPEASAFEDFVILELQNPFTSDLCQENSRTQFLNPKGAVFVFFVSHPRIFLAPEHESTREGTYLTAEH